jgi:hypothetical protein
MISVSEERIKTLPVRCRECVKNFQEFNAAGHPDDGQVFACGMMAEAMRESDPVGGCGNRVIV